MTRVKICGVRTVEAAASVRDAGVELAGLNFVPSSKRVVDRARASEVSAALGSVARVGVFQDQSPSLIRDLASALALDYVQLHGRETPEECAALSREVPPLIKAIAVAGEGGVDPDLLDAYAQHVAMFLFDGAVAGSGQLFAWDRLASVKIPRPYLIAGGLTPANVRAPLAILEPWAVDTASGIERGGAQDAEMIFAFVNEVRRA